MLDELTCITLALGKWDQYNISIVMKSSLKKKATDVTVGQNNMDLQETLARL